MTVFMLRVFLRAHVFTPVTNDLAENEEITRVFYTKEKSNM